jgi:glycine cleavage system pyridoxal-binding protein P
MSKPEPLQAIADKIAEHAKLLKSDLKAAQEQWEVDRVLVARQSNKQQAILARLVELGLLLRSNEESRKELASPHTPKPQTLGYLKECGQLLIDYVNIEQPEE